MITTISGGNRFAVQHMLKQLKDDFIKQHGSAGIETYSGAELTAQMLTSLVGGATLFAAQRLIIIKNLSANKPLSEQIANLASQVSSEVSLVIVEDTLDKRTAFYKLLKKLGDFNELGELSESAIQAWIIDYTTELGGTIGSSVARTLYQYVGSDQLALSNELAKLVAFNPKITETSVQELVAKSSEQTVFQLLDAVLGNQPRVALDILQNLEYSFEDPFAIINMLIWQTQIAAVVISADNRTDGEIAKQAQLNPYVVSKTRRLVKNLNRTRLNKLVEAVSRLDVTIKSKPINPWRLLEQTIVSL